MSFNTATRLPPSLSASLRSLSLKPQGISTLSPSARSTINTPSPSKPGSNHPTVERVRDVLTKQEYLMLRSTPTSDDLPTLTNQSADPVSGPTNKRLSKARTYTSQSQQGGTIPRRCISVSTGDGCFQVNAKPLVTSEGTVYFAKPLPPPLTERAPSIADQIHRSPILSDLESGECLGLNILVRKDREMELRSLYSTSPPVGEDHSAGTVEDENNSNQVTWYDPSTVRSIADEAEIFPAGAIPLSEVLK